MSDALAPHPRGITRRRLLQDGALVGAGILASSIAPLRVAAATVTPRRAPTPAELAGLTGTINDVEHVIFLMMENRSFDEVYGTLSGVRGFDDRTITQPNGASIFEQPDPTGAVGYRLPFLLSDANNGQDNEGLSHEWRAQHQSLNGGANDNWIPAHIAADSAKKGPMTMGYYTRDVIPYHYALADAFTICDDYHCSVLGPTMPNRFMWQTGSIDPHGLGGGPIITTDETVFAPAVAGKGFTWETYPERLQAAGIDWRVYTDQATNYANNMLPAFKQYQNPTTQLYARGMSASSSQLFTDIERGTLPQVAWIFPSAGHTEHPDDGPINAGPGYYHPVITALMNGPKWANTVLFLTWDENDGSFDHVPPPTAPPGTPGEWLTHVAYEPPANTSSPTAPPVDPSGGIEGPIGLGFRVPNIVISPFSRGGYVCSETFDHLSPLLFVEKRFGVELPYISAWRRSVVGDLTSALDFTAPDLSIPDLTGAFAAATASEYPESDGEKPPAKQVMPVQEVGTRQRRGPTPSWASPPTAVPEVPAPAVLVGAGLAAAAVGVARSLGDTAHDDAEGTGEGTG